MPRSAPPPGAKRKIIEVDAETWQAFHTLALDRMNTVQELADEAFADLLKKHNRPVELKEALEASLAGDADIPRRKSAGNQPMRRAPQHNSCSLRDCFMGSRPGR